MSLEQRHLAEDVVRRQRNHQAIVNVASLAKDAADAKVLLEVLGLIGEAPRSLLRLRNNKKRSA